MTSTHRAKKSLGQNFLNDRRIQERIIQSCQLSPNDVIVEIGPGQGVLTRLMAPLVKRIVCIEADRDLIGPLSQEFKDTNVDIILADFLKWDMAQLPGVFKVIGNIPYYISTPILEKVLDHRTQVHRAFLTVQLEFGQRLCAKPGGKDYGALTCFTQYYADVRMLFKIKSTCFTPPPKVDSCFISLAMRPQPEHQSNDEVLMFRLIRAAFNQRRKTLVNALSGTIDKTRLTHALEGLNIPMNIRGEVLSLKDYAAITNAVM